MYNSTFSTNRLYRAILELHSGSDKTSVVYVPIVNCASGIVSMKNNGGQCSPLFFIEAIPHVNLCDKSTDFETFHTWKGSVVKSDAQVNMKAQHLRSYRIETLESIAR